MRELFPMRVEIFGHLWTWDTSLTDTLRYLAATHTTLKQFGLLITLSFIKQDWSWTNPCLCCPPGSF